MTCFNLICWHGASESAIFRGTLGTFVRFYEFISQIVDYDDQELEKLSLYARNLRPLLREVNTDDDTIDLADVALSHYRLSKMKEKNLHLSIDGGEGLEPGSELGSSVAKDKTEEFLSQIIQRLNDLFAGDGLTDDDVVNYARTISDKVRENDGVMTQIANNTREQAMLGDFQKAVEDAILDSSEAHRKQMVQLLTTPEKGNAFANIIYEMVNSDRN
jgi:type I restriction enzyme R subunit